MASLADMMERDALTGLIDADGAREQMTAWSEAAGARGETASTHAMLLGLRRFSAVNLAYGEAAGDRALVEVAARMLHFARGEFSGKWLVSRVGGRTFLLAAAESCSRERWHWLAEELAQAVAQPIAAALPDEPRRQVRLSPRIALGRGIPGEAPQRLLTRLGETLETSRRQPGRRLSWTDGEVSVPGRAAPQLEADLLAALDRDEIEVLYQPQFSSEDGAVTGAEALARWQHPELGQIGAGALFAIAERADHVAQLSRHVMRAALVGAREWPESLSLSLNVTAADLGQRHFVDMVAEAVEQSGFPAQRLTLEITEQALVAELDRSAERLEQLVAKGIRIALDDFGAGFCNFRYLKVLPLHYLKLDRSMIDGITEDDRDLAVLRGIMAMARALDLEVIAEGVESEAQREAVTREGCAVWQGFLGAEPMRAGDFATLAVRGAR